MWNPQPLATLRESTACTGLTLPYILYVTLEINFQNISWSNYYNNYTKIYLLLITEHRNVKYFP
jgi:hypothetical protein